MIHGGPHYLETERELTRKSCEDSGAIQRIAPNLIFRIPILIPILNSDPRLYFEMVENFGKAYDRFSALKDSKPHVRLSGQDVVGLDPGFTRDIKGAISMDEWGIDPFRLVILTAKSAVASGAQIFTRTRVDNVELQGNQVVGVNVWRDGQKRLIRARTVINLSGPWATFVDPKRMPSVQLAPSRGVHLVLDRRVVNFSMVCKAADGRGSVFILPHEHTTIIGATDEVYTGNPDEAPITQENVTDLMRAVERYFPRLPEYRVMRALVGVRPNLPPEVNENTPGREHAILDHAKDGAEGLYSMVGGKLASYRMMAEELTDLICKRLKKNELCRTHLESLPGCTNEMPWREEAKRLAMDPLTVRRLMYRHGYKAMEILENARKNPELAQTLCECDQVLAAEVEYCVREEWAQSLSDIRRRTRLGMGPCQSCRCSRQTSLFLSSLLRWSPEKTDQESDRFINQRWQGNLPVLYGEQAKQEEYARALQLMAQGEGCGTGKESE